MLTCAACTGGAAECSVHTCANRVPHCKHHTCKTCRWSVVLIDLANANLTRRVRLSYPSLCRCKWSVLVLVQGLSAAGPISLEMYRFVQPLYMYRHGPPR